MNDATALADQVRAGEVDAATAVDEAIARCEEVNPTINAIVEQTYDTARHRAAHLDTARHRAAQSDTARQRAAALSASGDNSGLLAGVPIALKDLHCPA